MVATERLLDGHQHLCSAEAIVGVLNELPREDIDGLGLVVLRQETRKEQILRLAWGSMSWCDRFHGYVGPVLSVDAVDLTDPWFRWSGPSLAPGIAREIERGRKLGLHVEQDDGGYWLEMNAKLLRRWQLALTVPHEVGHWVDFKQQVLGPLRVGSVAEAVDDPRYGALMDQWWARPAVPEREEFAFRYAAQFQERLLRWLE